MAAPLWTILAEFPLFVLRALAYPRSLVRGLDWDKPDTLRQLALYAVVWLGLLVLAFGDSRTLAEQPRPLLNTYKGVVMRAHDRSWDVPADNPGWRWLRLRTVYPPQMSQPEAKRLWDTLLSYGFLSYAFLAGLLATAVIARLRMWRFGLSWEYALGTGVLGYLPSATAASLALVPLTLLLLCRHCALRLALFLLLNLIAWVYMGYYTLGDLGERPYGAGAMLLKSLIWGAAVYFATYLVFFALICCVIPL